VGVGARRTGRGCRESGDGAIARRDVQVHVL
jgi:hypothetical protein